jgi:hypothetical protein
MNRTRFVGMAAAMFACVSSLSALAAPAGSADLVRARQLFFGIENVDATTGQVRNDKVIFSWITNASLAASVKGRVILMDTYVQRLEKAPGRTPFVLADLVSLAPEAIFLGHGHFDHANNAAYIAGVLGIPIYTTPETCAAMQVDAAKLAAAGKMTATTVDCRPLTSPGSTPGAEVLSVSQLEPIACITVFKHLHSTTVTTVNAFPIIPVLNIADLRDPQMYPAGTAEDPIFGTSTGAGGPLSLFYQFVIRGDNRFTFVWHNTSGALPEGCGLDKCWGPDVGQHLVDIMHSLPPTDVEFGSVVSLGTPIQGTRDVVYYNEAIQPKIYVPIHQTNVALPTSSLEFKVSYLKQLVAMGVPPEQQPEPRWLVDPDDYVRPMVYDPKDPRWTKTNAQAAVGACK